ncbi:aminotransferase class I/II-fold pyridoxal phosphate-dependent enzyme [Candidatus Uhrbacteria bacterium]|nr:aminotransferase class I/II-fold pyridoxal phosphate-dependent enzyme [Candidatus Uhrbacteria bacterium]
MSDRQTIALGYSDPVFVDPLEYRVSGQSFLRRELPSSQMFLIKQGLEVFKRHSPDLPVYDASQGDGGASLSPIPPEEIVGAIARFLSRSQTTSYGKPEGDVRVREVLFNRYYRLEGSTDLSSAHVLTTCGGRDALQKWYQSIALLTRAAGQCVIVSAAPWQSYAQGGYLSGLNMLRAPTQGDFKMTPEGIKHAVEFAQDHLHPVVGLVLTSPDNPSGVYLTQQEIVDLIETAVSCGIKFVLLDLMYQMVLDQEVEHYDIASLFKTLTPQARGCVTILDGLTKSVGASNIRHAHLFCGSLTVAKTIGAISSHTVLTPVTSEALAFELYRHDDVHKHPWVRRVVEPTQQSRRLFREQMNSWGYQFVADQGYYAFVRVSPWLHERVTTVSTLPQYLTSEHGLAIIPGSVFHQPEFIRFSLANTPEVTLGAINCLHSALVRLP